MKINTENTKAIQDEITKAEHKCLKRLLDYKRIYDAIKTAENTLDNFGIPKKYWKGVTINLLPGKPSNSYKDRAEGTYATITRFPTGWFMTACHRLIVYSVPRGELPTQYMILTDDAKLQIPSKLWL